MKTIYYVVEKELEEVGDGSEITTGKKTIYMYEIMNGVPVKYGTIETTNEVEALNAMSEFSDKKDDTNSIQYEQL